MKTTVAAAALASALSTTAYAAPDILNGVEGYRTLPDAELAEYRAMGFFPDYYFNNYTSYQPAIWMGVSGPWVPFNLPSSPIGATFDWVMNNAIPYGGPVPLLGTMR